MRRRHSHYCVNCSVWKTDKNKYESLSCLLAPSNHLPGSLGKFNVGEYRVFLMNCDAVKPAKVNYEPQYLNPVQYVVILDFIASTQCLSNLDFKTTCDERKCFGGVGLALQAGGPWMASCLRSVA